MPPTDKDKRPPTSSEPARVAPAPVSSARLSTLNRLGALAATVAVIQTGCSGNGNNSVGAGPGPGPGAGGYAVVDPMPPPSRCIGAAGATTTTKAVWKAKQGGGFVIELTLGKPSRPDATYVTTEEPSGWSATIVSKQITADSAVITLEPSQGNQVIGLQIGVQCMEGTAQAQAHVSAQLELSKPPVDGAAIPVTLNDQY